MVAVTDSNPMTLDVAGRSATAAWRLTRDAVWRELGKASFAIVSHVNAKGEPRSSGVVYAAVGHRLYFAVAPDSWKARCIGATGTVSVVVPVRRGGILALLLPIPPATISFHASAIVRDAGSMTGQDEAQRALMSIIPEERRAKACIVELCPEGEFLTYGIGVSLPAMKDPRLALSRVPVS